MQDQYTFQEFRDIIARLRAKDGCLWDREQTHASLEPCMIEEAAELVSAVRIYDKTGSYGNMCEELGDVLLQVMMHSIIAEEEGFFTIEDVITGVSKKMIRRHPHVFGTAEAEDSDAVLRNWAEIKKKEKEENQWIDSSRQEKDDLIREIKSVIKKEER